MSPSLPPLGGTDDHNLVRTVRVSYEVVEERGGARDGGDHGITELTREECSGSRMKRVENGPVNSNSKAWRTCPAEQTQEQSRLACVVALWCAW